MGETGEPREVVKSRRDRPVTIVIGLIATTKTETPITYQANSALSTRIRGSEGKTLLILLIQVHSINALLQQCYSILEGSLSSSL